MSEMDSAPTNNSAESAADQQTDQPTNQQQSTDLLNVVDLLNSSTTKLSINETFSSLREDQRNEVQKTIDAFNLILSEKGLSIGQPFTPEIFQIALEQNNWSVSIYFYSHLRETYFQHIKLLKDRINILESSCKELESQLAVSDKLAEKIKLANSNIRKKDVQLTTETQDLKKQISHRDTKIKLLEEANNKLLSRSNQAIELKTEIDNLKVEINSDEYSRKQFGNNLLKIISAIKVKLNCPTTGVATNEIVAEDVIYNNIQDELIRILNGLNSS